MEISRETNGIRADSKENYNMRPIKKTTIWYRPRLRWKAQHTLQEEERTTPGLINKLMDNGCICDQLPCYVI
jgi:hypothetical protein